MPKSKSGASSANQNPDKITSTSSISGNHSRSSLWIWCGAILLIARCYNILHPLLSMDLEEDANIVDNGKCTLLRGTDGLLFGAEDTTLGKHGVLFVGSGDIGAMIDYGIRTCIRGGIYSFNINSYPPEEPSRIPIAGLPSEDLDTMNTRYQVHGIYLSNATNRLYAVVHRNEESSVEVFNVVYKMKNNTFSGVTLRWYRSIRSELFPIGGINDIVEGFEDDELYVTVWQLFDAPVHGKNGHQTVIEHLHEVVLRCIGPTCHAASPTIFTMANGITSPSDNRTIYYVADPPARTLTVLHREPSGMLTPVEQISTPYMIDNMDFIEGSRSIVMGTIVDFVEVMNPGLNRSNLVRGGSLTAVLPQQQGGKTGWNFQDDLIHDGTLLSQVSCSVRYGTRVLFGSPYGKGLLCCDL